MRAFIAISLAFLLSGPATAAVKKGPKPLHVVQMTLTGAGGVNKVAGGGGGLTKALDGTPQCTSAVIGTTVPCNFATTANTGPLGAGVSTFTLGLPTTTGTNDAILICVSTTASSITNITDNSGVTSAWTLTNNIGGASDKIGCGLATATSVISSGKTATITISNANDGVAAAAFAFSGVNTTTPNAITPLNTNTTSLMSFTATCNCVIIAFYNTSGGATDAGGGSWGSQSGGQVNGSPIAAGNPGIANSNMFGDVLEFQLNVTNPSSLSATLTGGTPTASIGYALQ